MPHPSSNAITPHHLIAALKRLISPPTPTVPDHCASNDSQRPGHVPAAAEQLSAQMIAELRALGREEPNYREIARQIVTQPELAATQTTLERRMAWQLLRDQRSARPAPVTAA